MSKTKHIISRMNQRSINDQMIEMVERFGSISQNGERLIIGNKCLNDLEIWTRTLLGQIEKMKKRGGLTLVIVNDVKITVFDNKSYKKGLKGNKNA